MRLSIIIPAHNEKGYLPDCLERVLVEVQTHPLSDSIEVLVIDNASTDGTGEVAGRFPGVQVVAEPTKGLTQARQRGLMVAQGDVLAFVDADTRMPQGWIARVFAAFQASHQIVCVSGPYIYYDASPIERLLVNLYWVCLAKPVYWMTRYMVVGGNFAAKREALLEIGGFDTGISFYGEDTNIARRLAAKGKVRFLMRLPMYTSARRLREEGLLLTASRYVINFLAEVILRRPVTVAYRDVR